ncbi:hypothetical protein F4810DRAFT_713240 [Camillea tinctor]|nr:hypothetical protein F4810DRAFT_713240 [Camillea tinctor]
MYVINSTELIPAVQKQWRMASFAGIAADTGKLVGMSKPALEIMHKDVTNEHGFSVNWSKYIPPVWANRIMEKTTTEAVWGPKNPYKGPAIAETWKIFESGFLTLSVFSFAKYIYPLLVRAHERIADATTQYIHEGGHEKASRLVKKKIPRAPPSVWY